MLDTATKRRIDTSRDILVGKVPDPKSQVEQVTIALIYKFMDDMDAESEEFGGERKFFAGEFARYGWAKLMRSGLGGHETLNLYAEAIDRMPENPGVPQLFRTIFNNAYLPYRDPETLRAFLKVIDEFEYDHSERLGDAYEYLLSILGTQGDAGQFRTPRHIIEFIVDIVDPKKHESVLDPASGTGGFLISAYKHILEANRDEHGNSTLTPDERAALANNFTGYDISPDYVRLALVNMYLHGFTDPHVFEYDTLTSEERWNEHADVILANPPFMSPKGGIRPHKRFGVQSKRSEVLFVDYMAEHLTPNGRAGIIVPEGIIFQSGSAYVQLREMLVNEFLVGVISLPSGVFMPYTGVKTSILILDRVEARRKNRIIFSEVNQIGFSLGVKRTPTEHNDLPKVLRDYRAFQEEGELSNCSWAVPREEIIANGYMLTGSRFRPVNASGGQRNAALGEVCMITRGTFSSTTTPPGPYPLIVTAEDPKTSSAFQLEGPAVCVPLISSLGHGKAALHRIHFVTGQFALANLLVALHPRDVSRLDAKYLYLALDARRSKIAELMRGAANVSMKPADLEQFEIPLPPLEVQRKIVAEIEVYQKVIDGARIVVDNYRPHIPIDPDWPIVNLKDVSASITDGDHQPPPKAASGIPFITISNIDDRNKINFENTFFVSETYYDQISESRKPRSGDVLYTVTGSYGVPVLVEDDKRFCFQRHIALIRPTSELLSLFLASMLVSPSLVQQGHEAATGVAQKTVSLRALREFLIPIPPIDVQRRIVEEIEAEQFLINANKKLIARFTTKIQETMARVWGESRVDPEVEEGVAQSTTFATKQLLVKAG